MKKIGVVIGGILAVVIIFGVILISNYNNMVEKSEKVDEKFAVIDVQLQRRANLIPNLVASVQGIMDHEKEVIDSVTSARERLLNSDGVQAKSAANDELTKALNNFIAIAEAYPDLKSNSNFTNLMDELSGSENRISTARVDYNNVVKEYNTYVKKFPNSLIAGMFGFNSKDYFKADEGSNETVKVNFN